MTQEAAVTEAAVTDVWKVAIAPDNIPTMTLDQLDAAFQSGQITERTLVWQEGMDQWLSLGDLLGGEDEVEEDPAPAAAPLAAAPLAAAPLAAASAPVLAAPPGFAAPAVVPAPPAVSVYPAAGSAPVSTAPMALPALDDVDLEFPKKKSKLGLLAAAAVLLGGVGFTAMNLNQGAKADQTAAAAAQPVAGTPLAANDPNAPLETGGYQISKKEAAQIEKENAQAAELKAKMMAELGDPKDDKEKAKAAKGAMKRKFGASSSGAKRSKPRQKKASSGIAASGGGDKFDPLNGSLP